MVSKIVRTGPLDPREGALGSPEWEAAVRQKYAGKLPTYVAEYESSQKKAMPREVLEGVKARLERAAQREIDSVRELLVMAREMGLEP